MKRTAIIAGAALIFSFSAFAQQPEPSTEQPEHKNATVASIQSKYKLVPMPEPLTVVKTFPVIGNYQFSDENAQTSNVVISLDEQNKGIVWISGLAEGKIKAYLKKAPSTYRIPPQKTEDGKEIAEGTLVFDKESNQLQMCIGCKYNEEDPALAFTPVEASVDEADKKSKAKAKTKAKVKVISYTGQKTDVGVATDTEAPQGQQ